MNPWQAIYYKKHESSGCLITYRKKTYNEELSQPTLEVTLSPTQAPDT